MVVAVSLSVVVTVSLPVDVAMVLSVEIDASLDSVTENEETSLTSVMEDEETSLDSVMEDEEESVGVAVDSSGLLLLDEDSLAVSVAEEKLRAVPELLETVTEPFVDPERPPLDVGRLLVGLPPK